MTVVAHLKREDRGGVLEGRRAEVDLVEVIVMGTLAVGENTKKEMRKQGAFHN